MVSHIRIVNCTVLSASWLLSSILFLCILLLFSCHVDYCYARDTLKQGDWITDNGETLVSGGETFELGFFTPFRSSSHKKFVGIWYKQDQQTVVWVANRDSPVLNGSTGTFGIAEDGNLKISDTTGKDYWSTFLDSSSTSRTLKLMDSGNLVLSDGDDKLAKVQWESFKNPTDTFLPGMNMDEILSLTSWIRDGDPGNGRFSFNLSQVGENKYVISQKAVFNGRERIPGKLYRIDEMPQVIAYLLSNFNSSVIKTTKLNPLLQNSTHRLSDYTSTDYNSTRLIMNYTGAVRVSDLGQRSLEFDMVGARREMSHL